MSESVFPIEPETAAYLQKFAQQAPRTQQSIPELRAGYRSNLIDASVKGGPTVFTRPVSIEGPAGPIEGRLYTPADLAPGGPLLIYVHGGGFVVGDLESHDALLRLVSKSGGFSVLALAYRLAPEHPFPAARDDVVATCRWAAENGHALGIDPARIALGGESAGAAHAMAAALVLKGSGIVAAVWVMSPALDATVSGDSYRQFASGAGRTAEEFAFLWSLYVPDAEMRGTPEVSPALADPTGLPPLFLYTAEFDPARDDGEVFAERAANAGVHVVLRRREGLIHQYPEITGVSGASREAVIDASRELAAHFASIP